MKEEKELSEEEDEIEASEETAKHKNKLKDIGVAIQKLLKKHDNDDALAKEEIHKTEKTKKIESTKEKATSKLKPKNASIEEITNALVKAASANHKERNMTLDAESGDKEDKLFLKEGGEGESLTGDKTPKSTEKGDKILEKLGLKSKKKVLPLASAVARGEKPPCICPDKVCSSKLDLAFAIDASAGAEQGGKEKMAEVTEFARRVASAFKVAPADSHLGLITFSTDAQRKLCGAKDSVRVKPHSGKFTGQALKLAKEGLFGAVHRPDALDVLVLITDGPSSDNVMAPARSLRDMGVKLITVGIGDHINKRQLANIASDPDDDNMFLTEFDNLQPLIPKIQKSACIGGILKEPTTPCRCEDKATPSDPEVEAETAAFLSLLSMNDLETDSDIGKAERHDDIPTASPVDNYKLMLKRGGIIAPIVRSTTTTPSARDSLSARALPFNNPHPVDFDGDSQGHSGYIGNNPNNEGSGRQNRFQHAYENDRNGREAQERDNSNKGAYSTPKVTSSLDSTQTDEPEYTAPEQPQNNQAFNNNGEGNGNSSEKPKEKQQQSKENDKTGSTYVEGNTGHNEGSRFESADKQNNANAKENEKGGSESQQNSFQGNDERQKPVQGKSQSLGQFENLGEHQEPNHQVTSNKQGEANESKMQPSGNKETNNEGNSQERKPDLSKENLNTQGKQGNSFNENKEGRQGTMTEKGLYVSEGNTGEGENSKKPEDNKEAAMGGHGDTNQYKGGNNNMSEQSSKYQDNGSNGNVQNNGPTQDSTQNQPQQLNMNSGSEKEESQESKNEERKQDNKNVDKFVPNEVPLNGNLQQQGSKSDLNSTNGDVQGSYNGDGKILDPKIKAEMYNQYVYKQEEQKREQNSSAGNNETQNSNENRDEMQRYEGTLYKEKKERATDKNGNVVEKQKYKGTLFLYDKDNAGDGKANEEKQENKGRQEEGNAFQQPTTGPSQAVNENGGKNQQRFQGQEETLKANEGRSNEENRKQNAQDRFQGEHTDGMSRSSQENESENKNSEKDFNKEQNSNENNDKMRNSDDKKEEKSATQLKEDSERNNDNSKDNRKDDKKETEMKSNKERQGYKEDSPSKNNEDKESGKQSGKNFSEGNGQEKNDKSSELKNMQQDQDVSTFGHGHGGHGKGEHGEHGEHGHGEHGHGEHGHGGHEEHGEHGHEPGHKFVEEENQRAPQQNEANKEDDKKKIADENEGQKGNKGFHFDTGETHKAKGYENKEDTREPARGMKENERDNERKMSDENAGKGKNEDNEKNNKKEGSETFNSKESSSEEKKEDKNELKNNDSGKLKQAQKEPKEKDNAKQNQGMQEESRQSPAKQNSRYTEEGKGSQNNKEEQERYNGNDKASDKEKDNNSQRFNEKDDKNDESRKEKSNGKLSQNLEKADGEKNGFREKGTSDKQASMKEKEDSQNTENKNEKMKTLDRMQEKMDDKKETFNNENTGQASIADVQENGYETLNDIVKYPRKNLRTSNTGNIGENMPPSHNIGFTQGFNDGKSAGQVTGNGNSGPASHSGPDSNPVPGISNGPAQSNGMANGVRKEQINEKSNKMPYVERNDGDIEISVVKKFNSEPKDSINDIEGIRKQKKVEDDDSDEEKSFKFQPTGKSGSRKQSSGSNHDTKGAKLGPKGPSAWHKPPQPQNNNHHEGVSRDEEYKKEDEKNKGAKGPSSMHLNMAPMKVKQPEDKAAPGNNTNKQIEILQSPSNGKQQQQQMDPDQQLLMKESEKAGQEFEQEMNSNNMDTDMQDMNSDMGTGVDSGGMRRNTATKRGGSTHAYPTAPVRDFIGANSGVESLDDKQMVQTRTKILKAASKRAPVRLDGVQKSKSQDKNKGILLKDPFLESSHFWPLDNRKSILSIDIQTGHNAILMNGSTIGSDPKTKLVYATTEYPGSYIILGDFNGTCFSDPGKCILGGLTLSFWVNLKREGVKDDQDAYIISGGGQSKESRGFGFLFFHGQYVFVLSTSNRQWKMIIPEDKVPTGKWVNIVFAWEKSKSLTYYLDGKKVMSVKGSSADRPSDKYPLITIGKPNNAESREYMYPLKMHSVAMWDRPLKSDQVEGIYEGLKEVRQKRRLEKRFLIARAKSNDAIITLL
ncbi:uncharacterized protein LOC135680954 [Rhopilema esculentum]|uniref:uncharacterized protein LOC135680954 n=1 Tax=Rhopilema esculentum TaxID=499914 RepID=UPI0031E08C5E